MNFGSLFSGIGGLDLGLERAGMSCEWQVEIDNYASLVLEKHWPNVRRWKDIQTFPPGDKNDWRVDLICGGFPCQPVSFAGKPLTAETGSSLWRTPDASVVTGGAANAEDRKRQGHAIGLHDQVNTPSMWPTPAARDWKSGKGRQQNGHTPQLPEVIGGQLNPTWVDWLMGFPLGWTDLEHSEMP